MGGIHGVGKSKGAFHLSELTSQVIPVVMKNISLLIKTI